MNPTSSPCRARRTPEQRLLSLHYKNDRWSLVQANEAVPLSEAQIKDLAKAAVVTAVSAYTWGQSAAEAQSQLEQLPAQVAQLYRAYGLARDQKATFNVHRVEEHRTEARYADALLITLRLSLARHTSFIEQLRAANRPGAPAPAAAPRPLASLPEAGQPADSPEYEFRENYGTGQVELWVQGRREFANAEYRVTARYCQQRYGLSDDQLMDMYHRYRAQYS